MMAPVRPDGRDPPAVAAPPPGARTAAPYQCGLVRAPARDSEIFSVMLPIPPKDIILVPENVRQYFGNTRESEGYHADADRRRRTERILTTRATGLSPIMPRRWRRFSAGWKMRGARAGQSPGCATTTTPANRPRNPLLSRARGARSSRRGWGRSRAATRG